MEPWFQMVATIVCAVVASSGFWAYIQKRSEKKDVRTQMLIGLAHDRIVYLGMDLQLMIKKERLSPVLVSTM